MTGLVAAHVMHALPFVLITVAAGLRSFDMRHEMIARCLGASPVYAFLTVVLPQIRFSVRAAAFLAFMSLLDEVVIASFISGGDMATLPKKMFSELRTSINPTIAAISTLLKYEPAGLVYELDISLASLSGRGPLSIGDLLS